MDDKQESEQLKRYKQTLSDIRYIYRTYKKKHPDEAWDCIRKLAYNSKLQKKEIHGSVPSNE